MARVVEPLNDPRLQKLLREKQPGMYADGNGLYLRIRNSGSANWTFRYTRLGRQRWMDLGNPKHTGLAEARKAARAQQGKLDAGRDPLDERKADEEARKATGTFRALAEEWYEAECAGRLKKPAIVRRALDKYLLPSLGKHSAAGVRPADCARLLERVRGTKPTVANDLLRYLKAIFAFGIRRHRVENSPVATFSARLDGGGQERSRSRALSQAELTQLFKAIRQEPTFGGDNLLIVRLLLALCVRKGELLGANWSEFDLEGTTADGAVWKLPSSRSKTGQAIDIPLAAQVVDWLKTAEALAAGSEWVFPSRRRDPRRRYEHVGLDTINVALGRVKHGLEPFTVHDFRRTARTQLANLGVAPHVAELCLNHKPKGIEAIYNQHSHFKERRAALSTWANLVSHMETSNLDTIVPIRRGSRTS